MRMLALILPLFLTVTLLIGCTSNERKAAAQKQKLTTWDQARVELARIKKIHFGAANQDLIDPHIAAREEYLAPHWWSHWKEELHYLEDDQPTSIVHYEGAPNDDWGDGIPMRWNGVNLYPYDQYYLSATGNLLRYVSSDSILYYYDTCDQLRKTIAYDLYGEDIEYIRLYDYDSHGNIKRSSVFFENDEKSLYLNHYDDYTYHSCDSGFYMKKIHHNEGDHFRSGTVDYYYFDEADMLRRQFTIYSGHVVAFTRYTYTTHNGKHYLKESIKCNLDRPQQKIIERSYRDSLNRVYYNESSSKGGQLVYNDIDSTVFKENGEIWRYYHGEGAFDIVVEKRDPFGNSTYSRMIHDLGDGTTFTESSATSSYQLLPQGTWYTETRQMTYYDFDEETSASVPQETETAYGFRKFTYTPLPYQNNYQRDPELRELLKVAMQQSKK